MGRGAPWGDPRKLVDRAREPSGLDHLADEAITEELGEEAIDVMAAALNEFTDRYGEAAAETVLAYQGTDFDRLP